MVKNHDLGRKGEDFGVAHLRELGYEILERNWRFSHAEIDIVAKKEEVLVFVEVKTRSSNHFGEPEEFINSKKENLIIDAANRYMESINHEWEIRFDVISIIWQKGKAPNLKHFTDVFY